MPDKKDQLLQELMNIDFAIIELNLYLDTHPNDTRAVEMYNSNFQKAKRLRMEYENLYGPLTMGHGSSRTPWQWIQEPWPWE